MLNESMLISGGLLVLSKLEFETWRVVFEPHKFYLLKFDRQGK